MNARRRMIGRCPVCQAGLEVTRLECPNCRTAIEGRFDPCKFCLLSPEQQQFVEIFLKVRGNIKEVERELGISYPTVRARLDAVLQALGYRVDEAAAAAAEARAARRKEILEALARGELSADDALKQLKQV